MLLVHGAVYLLRKVSSRLLTGVFFSGGHEFFGKHLIVMWIFNLCSPLFI